MRDLLQSIRALPLGVLLSVCLTGCTSAHSGSQAAAPAEKPQPITGSHIPIATNKTGRVYRESPNQVRTYSGTEIEQSGYSTLSEFLSKRGTLR